MVRVVFMQFTGEAVDEEREMKASSCTVIVALSDSLMQPPVVETVNENVPEIMGVPDTANTPALNDPVTPAGNEPAVIAAPVAPPPIAYSTYVIAVFTQTTWLSVPAAEVCISVPGLFTEIVPDKVGLMQVDPVVATV